MCHFMNCHRDQARLCGLLARNLQRQDSHLRLTCVQLVSHWMACAWMLQAVVYNAWFADLESTWLFKAGVDLDADSLQSRYIQAMYFSITIMATIGFGDITPSNGYERTLCIAAMVRHTCGTKFLCSRWCHRQCDI